MESKDLMQNIDVIEVLSSRGKCGDNREREIRVNVEINVESKIIYSEVKKTVEPNQWFQMNYKITSTISEGIMAKQERKKWIPLEKPQKLIRTISI